MSRNVTRQCMNCQKLVTLTWDDKRGYYRAVCTCGAHCTSDRSVVRCSRCRRFIEIDDATRKTTISELYECRNIVDCRRAQGCTLCTLYQEEQES